MLALQFQAITGIIVMYSRYSGNSETNDSELAENPEEMFLLYYMHSDDTCSNTYNYTILCYVLRKAHFTLV